jgi:tetratricopeptide (TPR) repeat protein
VAVIGYSALAKALEMRCRTFLRMGRLSEARADNERALSIARPRGDHEIVSWTLSMLPELKWLEGEPNGDRASIVEAVQLAEESGNWAGLVLALEGLAFAQLADGEGRAAVTSCERALAEGRAHQAGLFVESEVLALLARCRLAAGDPAGATPPVEEAVALAARQEARVSEAIARLARAHVRRAAGGPAYAISVDLDAALALVRDTGSMAYEPFIREELGRLRDDDAELREARRLFDAMGACGHVRRLDAELGARL